MPSVAMNELTFRRTITNPETAPTAVQASNRDHRHDASRHVRVQVEPEAQRQGERHQRADRQVIGAGGDRNQEGQGEDAGDRPWLKTSRIVTEVGNVLGSTSEKMMKNAAAR